MNFDPTKKNPLPGVVAMPAGRKIAVIQILYDPNTGNTQIQSEGFKDNVEELGALEWGKQMRCKLWCDLAGIKASTTKVELASNLPPNGRAQ